MWEFIIKQAQVLGMLEVMNLTLCLGTASYYFPEHAGNFIFNVCVQTGPTVL